MALPEHQPPPLGRTIMRGSFVNLAGAAGKLLYPVYLLTITRLFGPSSVGGLLLALSVLDVLSTLLIDGFETAILMLASPAIAERRDEVLYPVLADAVLLSAGLGALVAAATGLARPLVFHWMPGNAGAAQALIVVVWALPMIALINLAVAATRAQMTMVYDALVLGYVKPAALIACAVVARFAAKTPAALLISYLAAHVVCVCVAVIVAAVRFSPSKLASAVRRPGTGPKLAAFSVSSGVGSALNALSTNVTVLLLGVGGVPAASIALYATALTVANNVKQIRLLFSTAFAPAIARLHAAGNRRELSGSFNAVTGWGLAATLPVVLVLAYFRRDWLEWFHPSYGADTAFVLILLLLPILKCSIAGIAVGTTGYAKTIVANNVFAAALSAALAWPLISHYGIVGAAVAAAASTVALTIVELVEAGYLLSISYSLASVAVPGGAAVLAALCLAAGHNLGPSIGVRAVTAVASLVVYGAVVGAFRRFLVLDTYSAQPAGVS
jgi:O-antigen/teichoic acid export membrane protein